VSARAARLPCVLYETDVRESDQIGGGIDPFAYGYDSDGNLTSISDSPGGQTTLAWDGGLLVSKTYQDAHTQLRVDFSYDEDGNLVSQTQYAVLAGTQVVGKTVCAYDGNLVTSIVQTDAVSATLASHGLVLADPADTGPLPLPLLALPARRAPAWGRPVSRVATNTPGQRRRLSASGCRSHTLQGMTQGGLYETNRRECAGEVARLPPPSTRPLSA
jgi:YD repeat-containing protein